MATRSRSLVADWGYSAPIGGNLIGSGQWVFLWKGGFGMTGLPENVPPGADPGVLPVHARLHGHGGATIPTGSMAERWKFKSFVLWGLLSRGDLLPALRSLNRGGGEPAAAPRPRAEERVVEGAAEEAPADERLPLPALGHGAGRDRRRGVHEGDHVEEEARRSRSRRPLPSQVRPKPPFQRNTQLPLPMRR